MQRLHSEDLSGYLLTSSSSWYNLKISSIANQDYCYSINNYKYQYVRGNSLHNLRDNIDYLIKLEKEIGIYNYAAQYLQKPINDNSSLLKMEDISFYENLPDKFDYQIQS
ncbi:MAG: hypothetical protein RCG15_01530 [Candidatus Rickettsia vulgarisii]